MRPGTACGEDLCAIFLPAIIPIKVPAIFCPQEEEHSLILQGAYSVLIKD